MTLDFEEARGFRLRVWKAETNRRLYVIVRGETGTYTAKVGTRRSGDQEDVFRGAATLEAAKVACQSHSEVS